MIELTLSELFLFHEFKKKKDSIKPCTMHYSVNWAFNCDFDKTHPCICDFEFSQNVLRHVVFCHRIYNKILIAGRPLTGPVLVAFLLKKKRHHISLLANYILFQGISVENFLPLNSTVLLSLFKSIQEYFCLFFNKNLFQ